MRHQFFFVLLIPFLIGCDQKKADNAVSGDFTFNNVISVQEATQHQANYQALLDSFSVNSDSLANNGWVSLTDLEQYIALSKTFAQENNKALSGFRIYFAKHPANNGKEGNVTFFVSPTGNANVKNGYFQAPGGSGPEDDPDILFSPLNYINSGKPPKKEYPFDGE